MKIIRDRDSQIYKERNRLLGNCFTIKDNDKEYHYEFEIKGNEATIKTDNLEYISEVVNEFRFYNKYITRFSTLDGTYYEEFEPIFSFKLPINVIQPSQFFIDKSKLEIIENYMNTDNIYIPVAIINEEYVALDGHTRLYAMMQNYEKLVNVYIDEYDQSINDFVYIAKEQNIRNVKSMPLLEHNDYVKYWDGFCNDYFNNKE